MERQAVKYICLAVGTIFALLTLILYISGHYRLALISLALAYVTYMTG